MKPLKDISPGFLGRLKLSFLTAFQGMRLTLKYLRGAKSDKPPMGITNPDYFRKTEGRVTIQYPQEKIPVPINGRYRLYMETDDCIGCDKCARICPVDCITIETFRADGDLGKTSDGTIKRLHLPVFDIDMGKCMFCGLCTTVCPTECLFMTPAFDYSEFDRDNFVYHFGAYSPQDDKKIRTETEISLAEKKAAKAIDSPAQSKPVTPAKKPIFKKISIPLKKESLTEK